MGEGLGSVAYSEPPGSGGGGGGFPAIGARDGLSIASDYVVLGNLLGDGTYPAAFIDNRTIPMSGYALQFIEEQLGDPGTYFAINWPGSVLLWNSSSTDGGAIWSKWAPANNGVVYAGFGTGSYWDSSYAVYAGVNLPTTARPNVVAGFWMYNETFNFGQAIAGEAAFSFRTETFFVIGTDPNFEFHLPEILTDAGIAYRLDSTYVSRTTAIGFREMRIDDVTVFSQGYDPAVGQYYFGYKYNPGSDVSSMQVNSQNVGGVAKIALGNWTEGVSNCFIDLQDGLMAIENLGSMEIRSFNRIGIESAMYTNVVNPAVVSNSGLSSPNTDAMLDIQSTTLGFRVPAMTTAQRLAIATVALGGLIVFDTDLAVFYGWNGVAWITPL